MWLLVPINLLSSEEENGYLMMQETKYRILSGTWRKIIIAVLCLSFRT